MRWLLLLSTVFATQSFGARVKDLVQVKGARYNQLSGYGLVVGLGNSGDRGFPLTDNSLNQVLKGLWVQQEMGKGQSRNSAAVLVNALLPPFSRNGSQVDVTVSSIGTATSLDGGTLMVTSLRAPDGKVYAVAQGKVIITKRPERIRGQPSGQTFVTGLVPGGALVEREVPFDMSQSREVEFVLLNPDFTTSARIARRINEELGGKYATSNDAASVHVIYPYSHMGSAADILAQVENVEVEADRKARVVVNQRTGTVVLGTDVRVLPVAIAHNNLQVEVKETAPQAATANTLLFEQPLKPKRLVVMDKGATISDLVATLNDMGASADDMVALIQTLKSSGALLAEVVVQ